MSFCSQVWGFAVIQDETRLITGCSDNELRIWKISRPESNETENSEKEGGKRTAAEAHLQDDSVEKIDEVWLCGHDCTYNYELSFCKLIST